jgi:ABC-type hemin transport system ATPase subunit
MIDPNKPIKNPDEDKLGYKLFSQDLARNIVKMTPADGFVIGLTGPWGSGKSTSLLFTECYLTEKKDELSLNDGEIPLILYCDPIFLSIKRGVPNVRKL